VVLFHLWPSRLPGGYVGVDIFFVISGFLIVGQLIRTVERRGRVDLMDFWARRARRLLPASLLVLSVTGIATVLWVPTVMWRQWFQEIIASALYVQNWLLAYNSVDYLGSENNASPAQHFWSLSVEEQFYILWPIIIVLLLLVGRRLSTSRNLRIIRTALIVVTVVSFVVSVMAVATDPAPAYFTTQSRAWEFGVGGLLAYFARSTASRPAWLRASASWLGLLLIGMTLLVYTESTPFPGATALLPVVGTLLVIWAGTPPVRWAPTGVMSFKLVQWVGDISYSLYLWHWPLLIILPYVLHHPLGLRDRLVILAAGVVLAWLTKTLVEDPIRTGRYWTARRAWVSLATMLAPTLVTVALSGAAYGYNANQVTEAAARTQHVLAGSCVGAAATIPGSECVKPYAVTSLTDPAFAQTDIGKGVQVTDECKQTLLDSTVKACEVGDLTNPAHTVALIGDSHAGHFLEAFDLYGQAHRIKFVTYLKTWCVGTGTPRIASPQSLSVDGVRSCEEWGKQVLADVAGNPHIDGAVFSDFTQMYTTGVPANLGHPLAASDFAAAWRTLQAAGKTVIALRDIPNDGQVLAPQCVAQNLGTYDPCAFPRADAEVRDAGNPMVEAAHSVPGVSLVDLTDVFCDPSLCHAVIGGLIVYFDSHHMTATFSRTLAPIVGAKITAALEHTR
jgi:peptidoglycan/LPS O-acetylase OafA/YrhL